MCFTRLGKEKTMEVDHAERLLEAFPSPLRDALAGHDDVPEVLRDAVARGGDGLEAGDAAEQIPLPSLEVCPLNDPNHLLSRHPLAADCVDRSVPRRPAVAGVKSDMK